MGTLTVASLVAVDGSDGTLTNHGPVRLSAVRRLTTPAALVLADTPTAPWLVLGSGVRVTVVPTRGLLAMVKVTCTENLVPPRADQWHLTPTPRSSPAGPRSLQESRTQVTLHHRSVNDGRPESRDRFVVTSTTQPGNCSLAP